MPSTKYTSSEIYDLLTEINSKLDKFILQETKMANQLDTDIAALQTAVTNEVTVEASASTLISGIPALITAAVNAALAAGATQAELTSLTNLATQISGSATGLANAVAANTPAAPAS